MSPNNQGVNQGKAEPGAMESVRLTGSVADNINNSWMMNNEPQEV